MPLINSIAGIHKKHVTGGSHAARTHIMLRDTEFFHHVQYPHRVGFDLVRSFFFCKWSVVFSVAKSFRVEAFDLTATADVPESITLNERCTADSLQRPIVHATGRKFFTGILPEKRTILDVEC